jgi:hypothetical protein
MACGVDKVIGRKSENGAKRNSSGVSA